MRFGVRELAVAMVLSACSGAGVHDAGCSVSENEFCASYAANCGVVVGFDSCFVSRSVDCGHCGGTQLCNHGVCAAAAGGGTANSGGGTATTGGGTAAGGGTATGGGIATGGGTATGGGIATGGGSATDGGVTSDGGVTTDGGTSVDAGQPYDSAAKLLAYFEGKTMIMAGNDIPSDPFGYSENINFSASTQCYSRIQLATVAGQFVTTSTLGTLVSLDGGVLALGEVGVCHHDQPGSMLNFTTTALVLANVQGNGRCFDLSASYSGFSTIGRGSISADGKLVVLEEFFQGMTTGANCDAGDVGSATIRVLDAGVSTLFLGNAKQVYRLP